MVLLKINGGNQRNFDYLLITPVDYLCFRRSEHKGNQRNQNPLRNLHIRGFRGICARLRRLIRVYIRARGFFDFLITSTQCGVHHA